MKTKLILFISIIHLSLAAQNLLEIDKKNGYMDIKIGSPISSLGSNVFSFGDAEGVYAIQNISKYKVDGHNIDRIIIKVTKDDKQLIEQVSLAFLNPRKELMKTVYDETKSYEDRKAAGDKLESLKATDSEFFFYRNLFQTAFGKFTKTEDSQIWTGKKVTLSATFYDGDGICTFSSVKSLTSVKKVDPSAAKKASSKF
jgi:hypothetical protein